MARAGKHPPGRKAGGEGPRAFEARLERSIVSLGAGQGGERWLVALSGGPDSVALLRTLCVLAPRRQWRVSAVHVHHGIRGKSADLDAAFCEKLCETLHVPIKVVRLRVPKGSALAERARKSRYEALEKESRRVKARWVALAHQADDQAETLLSRLGRGSALAGLSGIPPVRSPYVRPLLGESREAILHYLGSLEQGFRTDPSNRSLKSERSRIRYLAIPALERALGRPVQMALARSALEAAEAAAYLEEAAAKEARRIARRRAGRIEISALRARALAPALRKALWRSLLAEVLPGGVHLSGANVEAIERLLKSGEGRGEVALAGGAFVRREGARLVVDLRPKPSYRGGR